MYVTYNLLWRQLDSIFAERPAIFALAARKVGKCKKSKLCKINPPTVTKAISDYIKLLSQLSCGAECYFTIICITNIRSGSLAATYAYLIAQVSRGETFAILAVFFHIRGNYYFTRSFSPANSRKLTPAKDFYIQICECIGRISTKTEKSTCFLNKLSSRTYSKQKNECAYRPYTLFSL